MPAPAPSFASAQVAYLLADPVGHSWSPTMHNAAFKHLGWAAEYLPWRVPEGRLPEALAHLRRTGVLGGNLSLPHKQTALAHLDQLSEAAQAIGAVNTVVNRDEQLHGENTDAAGFWADLCAAGKRPPGDAVVLGAGGAARAVVWILRREHRGPLWVLNRTHDHAEQLCAELGGQPGAVEKIPWQQVSLLVNASSAGLDAPDHSPLSPLPSLAPGALVYDLVYRPLQTRLLREAQQRGYKVRGGLGMLAEQARLSFALWTGELVPLKVFMDALPRESAQESA